MGRGVGVNEGSCVGSIEGNTVGLIVVGTAVGKIDGLNVVG